MRSSKLEKATHTIVAAVLAAGLGAAAQAADNTPVASVGSVTVTQQDVTRLLQSMPEAERAAVKANHSSLEVWLRQRLATQAVVQEAKGKGWDKRPEVKAQVDAAVRDLTERVVTTTYLESVAQVPANYPSDAELRAAYDRAKANFQVPATYHVAQIFLAAPAGDTATIDKARAQIQQLAAQAKTGDFADLARKNSQDQRSAAQGGDVGTLPLAQLLPEVRDPVARLQPGQVSDPVQSQSGFHLLKLLDSAPAHQATLDEVKPRLSQLMRQQRQQELVQAYVARLAPPASMQIDSGSLDTAVNKAN